MKAKIIDALMWMTAGFLLAFLWLYERVPL